LAREMNAGDMPVVLGDHFQQFGIELHDIGFL
jgi:hypothetical protein